LVFEVFLGFIVFLLRRFAISLPIPSHSPTIVLLCLYRLGKFMCGPLQFFFFFLVSRLPQAALKLAIRDLCEIRSPAKIVHCHYALSPSFLSFSFALRVLAFFIRNSGWTLSAVSDRPPGDVFSPLPFDAFYLTGNLFLPLPPFFEVQQVRKAVFLSSGFVTPSTFPFPHLFFQLSLATLRPATISFMFWGEKHFSCPSLVRISCLLSG